MSSIISDSTYETIARGNPPSLGGLLVKKTVEWRDQNANVARRITCGLAITAGSLIGLIEAVASAALAILTSPAELAGIKLSRSFFTRSLFSALTSAFSLTYLMYYNITKDSIYDSTKTLGASLRA